MILEWSSILMLCLNRKLALWFMPVIRNEIIHIYNQIKIIVINHNINNDINHDKINDKKSIPNKKGTGESSSVNSDSGRLNIKGCGHVKGLSSEKNVCIVPVKSAISFETITIFFSKSKLKNKNRKSSIGRFENAKAAPHFASS